MNKKLPDSATSSSCGGGCTQQVQNGTKGMDKLICNQKIHGRDRHGPWEIAGGLDHKSIQLVSFPQSSLCSCSHRSSITGPHGLLVWPIRAPFMLRLFPHTNLLAFIGSKAKQKIEIQNFSWCTVPVSTHMHKILKGCYFHYTYFWIISLFHGNVGCLLGVSQLHSGDNAAELLSAAALEHNTIWQTRKTILNVFTTNVPEVSTVLVVCVRQESALLNSNQPGKS